MNSLRVMVDTIIRYFQWIMKIPKSFWKSRIFFRDMKTFFGVVNEMRVLSVKEELQKKVKERVDKNQREYILKREMKLIRRGTRGRYTSSRCGGIRTGSERFRCIL